MIGLFGLVLRLPCAAVFSSSQPFFETVMEWNFSQQTGFMGWQPNSEIISARFEGDHLHFETIGTDPIWEYTLPFELTATPWQVIELRLKSDRDGMAEVFWSNTTDPPFGGFRPEKRTPFWIKGDGRWHLYRIIPFWQSEGKIIRLRFDPFGGARFDLDFIRIVQWNPPPSTDRSSFAFSNTLSDWQPFGELKATATPDGVALTAADTQALFLSPPLKLPSQEKAFATLELTADGAPYATFLFTSSQRPGLHSLTFPVSPDGRRHTYNIDLLSSPFWTGEILAVGVRPPVNGAKFLLHSLSLSSSPGGRADVRVKFFGVEEKTIRIGQKGTVTLVLTNTGGETARISLDTPKATEGLEIISAVSEPSPSPRQTVYTLSFSDDLMVQFSFRGTQPGRQKVSVTVRRADGPPLTAETSVDILPPLSPDLLKAADDPRPAHSSYQIGVYYFPGWKTWSQWSPIFRFPERKPLLGLYQEGDPIVADWHIRWAVEHGITFFAYDWYWEKGARQLEHALHDGYFLSRHKSLLKFCLLWANHNTPGSSSFEDCLTVTKFWIDHYFRRPEYLTWDGKPMVIIFSRQRLTEDLTSDGVRKAFDAMRQLCVDNGLPGLYLIACINSPGEAVAAASEGYDAVTAYNWPFLGLQSNERWADFESLCSGYHNYWEEIVRLSSIPLLLPISGGWDSRPWQGDSAVVRFGRNPSNFAAHLSEAKRFLDRLTPSGKVLPMAIIEAWNEWGEGSYIEPHQEHGFAYLDAIRTIFCDSATSHTDLVPADLGQTIPQVIPDWDKRTEWDFDNPEDPAWTHTMNLSDVKISDGRLMGITLSSDPAFFGPSVALRSSDHTRIQVRMRLTPMTGEPAADVGQVFWRTSTIAESEASSVPFPVSIDGQWHTYELAVTRNPRWRGTITRLRLDPCTRPKVLVEVDWIRLIP